MKSFPQLFQFIVAGFVTGTALIIWAYTYFYPRAEAKQLKDDMRSLHQIHREDIREVKEYLKEIRDAMRGR